MVNQSISNRYKLITLVKGSTAEPNRIERAEGKPINFNQTQADHSRYAASDRAINLNQLIKTRGTYSSYYSYIPNTNRSSKASCFAYYDQVTGPIAIPMACAAFRGSKYSRR